MGFGRNSTFARTSSLALPRYGSHKIANHPSDPVILFARAEVA